MTARTLRTRIGAALVGAAFVLSACSSSGGGVSQSQLESKLKSESQISSAKSQLGSAKFNALVTCVAQVMKKDIPSSTLQDYVAGKKNLTSVGSADTKKLTADTTACAKKSTKSG